MRKLLLPLLALTVTSGLASAASTAANTELEKALKVQNTKLCFGVFNLVGAKGYQGHLDGWGSSDDAHFKKVGGRLFYSSVASADNELPLNSNDSKVFLRRTERSNTLVEISLRNLRAGPVAVKSNFLSCEVLDADHKTSLYSLKEKDTSGERSSIGAEELLTLVRTGLNEAKLSKEARATFLAKNPLNLSPVELKIATVVLEDLTPDQIVERFGATEQTLQIVKFSSGRNFEYEVPIQHPTGGDQYVYGPSLNILGKNLSPRAEFELQERRTIGRLVVNDEKAGAYIDSELQLTLLPSVIKSINYLMGTKAD